MKEREAATKKKTPVPTVGLSAFAYLRLDERVRAKPIWQQLYIEIDRILSEIESNKSIKKNEKFNAPARVAVSVGLY